MFDVGALADSGQYAPPRSPTFFHSGSIPVEPEGAQKSEQDHHVELQLYGGPEAPACEPDGNDKDIPENFRHGRTYMGEPALEEHVMEVGLVRTEGRGAAQDPAGHDPQRVEDRNGQYRQCEGDEAEVVVGNESERRIAFEHADDEIGHDRAHHQRTAVAQKHFGLVAEDVVQEEGNQGAGKYRGERGAFLVARPDRHRTESDTCHDAIARTEAVHAVDEVDGVDDAHAGEDRQRDRDPVGNGVDTPQTVEIVDVSRTAVDEQHDDKHLHAKSEKRRQGEDVVHRSDAEHEGKGAYDREHFRGFELDTRNQQRHDDAEEHGYPSQARHRNLLQLACIRIVGNIFQNGDPVDVPKNPPGTQHSRNEQNQVIDFIHSILIFKGYFEFMVVSG